MTTIPNLYPKSYIVREKAPKYEHKKYRQYRVYVGNYTYDPYLGVIGFFTHWINNDRACDKCYRLYVDGRLIARQATYKGI